jgi:hypothetical protein
MSPARFPRKSRGKNRGFFFSTDHGGAGSHPVGRAKSGQEYASPNAQEKEIESPKLTADFLLWISAFVLLLFALIAHFVWKVF